jgi:outer membrane protein assembly factor BamB
MKYLLLAIGVIGLGTAGEWPRFRGPNGSGVADGAALPAELGADKPFVWKTALMKGKSSPVVTSSRIFLTGHEGGKLFTIGLDRKTGKILWTREAPGAREEKRNALNDPAAPSAVSDGTNVYVFFAGFGLLSYTADGVERWRTAMGPFSNFHGMGASPVYADGRVFMIVDRTWRRTCWRWMRRRGSPFGRRCGRRRYIVFRRR